MKVLTQKKINENQNIINEQTKVDLVGRNFIAIILFVITVTSAYLFTQFNTYNKIIDTNNKIDIVVKDVSYIRDNLTKHLEESVQARKDMKLVASQRDYKFNEIDKTLIMIKAILKID